MYNEHIEEILNAGSVSEYEAYEEKDFGRKKIRVIIYAHDDI